MKPLSHPSLNYIGVFLTFGCNLNCSYCINDPEQRGDRKKVFQLKREHLKSELTPDEWAQGLSRIPVSQDLPITFQGGEPTMYHKGRGLGEILSRIDNYADLLTNFALEPEVFAKRLLGQKDKLRRPSPYPPIRVSLHVDEMNKTWGNGFEELIRRCLALKNHGFVVSPDPGESDIGIYIVDHPENDLDDKVLAEARTKLPVLLKDFLGMHHGRLYGSYIYPYSTNISLVYHRTLQADCKGTELLIDPLGFVWPCHLYLYRMWETAWPPILYSKMANYNFSEIAERFRVKGAMFPVGHIMDPDFDLSYMNDFHACFYYGQCLECDTKVKKDRFGSENIYRSSVVIKNIQWPKELRHFISNDHKRTL